MPEALEFDISLYPDPVLRKEADPVQAFDDELERIVRAMYQRMFESHGVGLAAPQVGLRQRILVINEESNPDEPENNVTLINPRIVSRDGEKTTHEEGCLSFPEIYAEVVRPERCTVEAVDLEGQPLHREFSGFLSRIVQHEYDHLEGILLVDRMSPADKLKNKVALEELVAEYKDRRDSS